MDIWDGLVLVGLALLGLAVGLAWGWLAALGYGSVILVVAGVVGATLRGGRDVRSD